MSLSTLKNVESEISDKTRYYGRIVGNMCKIWSNYGTYGHSKLISFFVMLYYHALTKFIRIIYRLLDMTPFISNKYSNPNKLSVELRTFLKILNLQKYFFIIRGVNRCKWKGPRLDWLFITLYNTISNYCMTACVPIPWRTIISKQKLNKLNSNIIQKLKLLNIDISENESVANYNQFCPREVNLLWVSGNDYIKNKKLNNILLFIHGGGYALGGPSHIGYVSKLSLKTNTKILFVDYTKPPKADIPNEVDQILTAYFYLLFEKNINHKNIVICGDSAGGGLCALVLQKLSFFGLTDLHPIGTILLSPFVDLTLTMNNSWQYNYETDWIVTEGMASRSALIAVGNDESRLRSPFVSAVFAPCYDIKSNVMLFVSKNECLLDDSRLLLKKLKPASEQYEIICKEVDHMPHVFPVFDGAFPEANQANIEISQTILKWFK
eukprot:180412_1